MWPLTSSTACNVQLNKEFCNVAIDELYSLVMASMAWLNHVFIERYNVAIDELYNLVTASFGIG